MKFRWKRVPLYFWQFPNRTTVPAFVREVLFLQLEDESGMVSIGEIAPLPNWGTESIEEAEQLLERVSTLLPKTNVPAFGFETLVSELSLSTYPATAFGLSILFELYSIRKLQTDVESYSTSAPIAATIFEFDLKTIHNTIAFWNTLGCHTIKLKVHSKPSTQLFEQLFNLVESYPNNLFRLDFNERWDFHSTQAFLVHYSHPNIQYLEQPLKRSQIHELLKLSNFGSIPIAVDESATNFKEIEFWLKESNGIIVMKPCTMGSIQLIRKWLETNSGYHSRIVLSSGMDSILSAFWYVWIQHSFQTLHQPSGIGTFFYTSSPIQIPYRIEKGILHFSGNWFRDFHFPSEVFL
ncbi:MAG: hypothetical protein N2450_07565 [bacterium]|nr:hypothetical protein [bacterium]